jgi:hypothetical protein
VLNDWTMALLGPGFVAMGALVVASGFWIGLVSLIIGAWTTWEGGVGSPTGGAAGVAPDTGSEPSGGGKASRRIRRRESGVSALTGGARGRRDRQRHGGDVCRVQQWLSHDGV